MTLIQGHQMAVALGSRQDLVISLQAVFLTIALVIFLLRIYTRTFILRFIGLDDYFMGFAVIFSIALAVTSCVSTKFGWGKHISDVPLLDLSPILFIIWLAELLFTIATSLVKISILLFYLRIAVTQNHRRLIYGSIAFICAWAITFSCVVVFQCKPVNAYWDPFATSCYKPQVPLFIHGLTNTITDIYVYVLPMQMIWKIRLPKRQRIVLLVIFGAGFLVCVAGIIRLYYSIITQNSEDATWVGIYLWTWESVEINLGIICASAPCLKALVARLAPSFMSYQDVSAISQTPAQFQLKERRAINQQNHDSGSIGDIRRALVRESGESQQGLRKVHEHVLIAKADVDYLP